MYICSVHFVLRYKYITHIWTYFHVLRFFYDGYTVHYFILRYLIIVIKICSMFLIKSLDDNDMCNRDGSLGLGKYI